MKICYAVYKGDEFIDLGSIRYLAGILGIKEASLRFYMSPTYAKRIKSDKRYFVIRI